MAIHYCKGDATHPLARGNNIVAHICNDTGGWGKGFVLAISKRWPEPEASYRKWFASKIDFGLGQSRLVQVEPDLWVCNMIAQHGLRHEGSIPPIRYDALDNCLEVLAKLADVHSASIHMPRIGCGLAGGKWEEVEPLIAARLSDCDVYVYDL